ncbi:MAG: hypothetical protein V2B15_19865 [Bacteroidota bacterium]
MQQKILTRTRRAEVFAGLMLIIVAFSYVASLLLDFKFVSPYATLQEDLAYLSEHIRSQKISSCAWLATAVFTGIALPFYFAVFRKRLRVLHYINGLLMLGATTAFVMMALTGLGLPRELAGDKSTLSLLEQFSQEQLFRYIGSSCVGLWAFGLGLTKIRLARFPLISSVLLIISGPALVFFDWYDPDHPGHTGAMACIIIGVMIFCVRLINRGMSA